MENTNVKSLKALGCHGFWLNQLFSPQVEIFRTPICGCSPSLLLVKHEQIDLLWSLKLLPNSITLLSKTPWSPLAAVKAIVIVQHFEMWLCAYWAVMCLLNGEPHLCGSLCVACVCPWFALLFTFLFTNYVLIYCIWGSCSLTNYLRYSFQASDTYTYNYKYLILRGLQKYWLHCLVLHWICLAISGFCLSIPAAFHLLLLKQYVSDFKFSSS